MAPDVRGPYNGDPSERWLVQPPRSPATEHRRGAPMYSPVRPAGATSATYAVAVGKKIISPNVHTTTVNAIGSAAWVAPSAPKPMATSTVPTAMVGRAGQCAIAVLSATSRATMSRVLRTNSPP